MNATIFEIKRFALHDGPGIRTTVFFKGCPLKCVWCHNPEGLSPKAEIAFFKHKCIGCGECRSERFTPEDCLGEAKVLYGRAIGVDELLPILLSERDFYESSGGGVTLSGGECLIYPDFCLELLRKLKEKGIHTAVDTSGFVPRESIDKVMPYTDLFLYDIKAAKPEIHEKCTGKRNEIILDNLRYISSKGKQIEIRIPYVPGYNDGEITEIAHLIAPLKHVSGVRILPYHNLAGSKYDALGIINTLPDHLPTEDEINNVENIISTITDFKIVSRHC